MCVYMCVCKCVSMFVCECAYVCACVCMHVCVHVCACVYVCVHVCVCVFECVCVVSYPDPYVRNDDHRLQYDITYRGSGNKVVRNGSSATECCCTNQIAAICDVDIPMLWPSANCISSMPIVKPLPKVRRD